MAMRLGGRRGLGRDAIGRARGALAGALLAALAGAAPALAQYAPSPYAAPVPAAPVPAAPAPLAPPASAMTVPPPAPEPAALSFAQRGIPAEASAENGVLAREQAFAAGRLAAWDRMLSEAGIAPVSLPDSQIESLVNSIVIEQERTLPTRYIGRITVNFSPGRVRNALGARAPGGAPAPAGTPPAIAASPQAPASTWVEAVAIYRSMGEWLELRRRLQGAGPVASVEIRAIAVDAARLRLGLRSPPPVAAGELSGFGVAVTPMAGPSAGAAPPGESWRVDLAGGG